MMFQQSLRPSVVFFELFFMNLLIAPKFIQSGSLQGCFYQEIPGCALFELHTLITNEKEEIATEAG